MTKMKFIRFGGLSPIKQTHYDTSTEKPFHNPPRKNGIYAFPYPYIEKFLLDATNEPWNTSNKTQWLKDDDGNKILESDFWKYDFNINDHVINSKYISIIKKQNINKKDLGSCIDKKTLKDTEIIVGESFSETTAKYEIRREHTYMTVLKKPKIFEYNGNIWSHIGYNLKPHQIIETSGSWYKTDMENYLIAMKKEFHSTKRELLKMTKDINLYKDKDPFKNFYAKDTLEVFIEKIK